MVLSSETDCYKDGRHFRFCALPVNLAPSPWPSWTGKSTNGTAPQHRSQYGKLGVVPVDAMATTATAMGFKSVDDLYLAIAQDRISVRQVIRVLVESIG